MPTMVERQLALALHADDPRWVREEFEAIIAAEWPAPAANPPRLSLAVVENPVSVHGTRVPDGTACRVLPWRSHGPGKDGWARERSPPRADTVPAPTLDEMRQGR